jgi:predicted GTPase
MIPAELMRARHVLVIGAVSVGKSSLLNVTFGLHLRVGVGHTTAVVDAVVNTGQVVVWDSPGADQDFEFYKPETLNFIYSMNLVVILFKTSLSTVGNIVRVVHKIKGSSGMNCVRTMCDMYQQGVDALTLQEETARDHAYLAAQGVTGVDILLTAARGPNPFQLDAVRACILGA